MTALTASSHPPLRRGRIAQLRYLAVRAVAGLAIYCGTTTAVSFAHTEWTLRQPLPGGTLTGEQCALWFVGSSTISRWDSLGRDMAPWPVRNRGVGGASLDELARRLMRDGPVDAPAGIVVYAGENDIARGRSVAWSAARLDVILDEGRRLWPGTLLMVIGAKPSPARWPDRAAQLRYNAVIAATAKRHGATYLPNGEQLLRAGRPDPALFVEDGIHLNAAGYERWVATLRPEIAAAMKPAASLGCR